MVIGNPFPLKRNAGKSFQGSIVLGKGFIVTSEEAKALIDKHPRNKDVLFPYLNGDDLNNDPQQKPSRWVVNFFDWTEEKARTYSECFEIVERRVKSERQRWKVDDSGNEIIGTYALRKPRVQKWWQYGERAAALYETISKLDQVMVINRHAKYLLISRIRADFVYSEATVVIALNDPKVFSVLSSSVHEAWAWKNSSTMGGGTLRYSATQAFEAFAFPALTSKKVEEIGLTIEAFRKELMLKAVLGLTDLYNIFNRINLDGIEYKHDIYRLRQLHIDLDNIILDAYGWSDIRLNHDFYQMDYLPENDRVRFSIHPDARKLILKRLLLLNHELYSSELASKVTPQKGMRTKDKAQVPNLFSDPAGT